MGLFSEMGAKVYAALDRQPDPEQGISLMVHWYGSAHLMTQTLEMQVRMLILFSNIERGRPTPQTPAEIREPSSALPTFGVAVREVRHRGLLSVDLVDRLERMVQRRNKLTHEFLSDLVAHALAGPEAWNRMQSHCRQIVGDSRSLSRDLTPSIEHALNSLNITPETLQAAFAELAASAQVSE